MPLETDVAYEALMQFLYRAPIGLVQTTAQGVVEMINPMAASLLLAASKSGQLDDLFTALEDLMPQLRALVADFVEPSGTVCDSLRIAIPVPLGAQWLSFSLVKLDASRLMAMLSDVTLDVQREQAGLTRRLVAAARVDALTEMPNRAVACEVLSEAIARTPQPPRCDLAVLFINCDRFKHINDTAGHAAGDEVLRVMSERLRSTLRQYDRASASPGRESMAARVGGDEFVVILGDLRFPDDLHAIAQRLFRVITQPYGVNDREIHCNVSMGIVLRPQMKSDPEAVLQDANTAMIEAKRAGGARYVIFQPAMQERAARRNAIESELRRAVVDEELFVVYQPVVYLQGNDPARDRAAGVEALVRWRHPIRGIVPPQEFITVAEECGLIGVIGDYVLEKACRQFVQWRKDVGARAPRLLAVNLSRLQLNQPGFIASVAHILGRSGMLPDDLQLEITESLAAQDETVRERLQELKSLGLTLALDDFGTGYSSLSSLHQLPVDTIKIDRSFVSEAVTSAHHRVLIEATVRVAKSLNMGTVAEGIETPAQAEVVRALGCAKGQGYLFSKPLVAADLIRWLMAEDDLYLGASLTMR
jgi:diguanylate cyclase (GGDEF)-like protein